MNRYTVMYIINVYAETPGDAVVETRDILDNAVMRDAINATYTKDGGTAKIDGTKHTADKHGWSCITIVKLHE